LEDRAGTSFVGVFEELDLVPFVIGHQGADRAMAGWVGELSLGLGMGLDVAGQLGEHRGGGFDPDDIAKAAGFVKGHFLAGMGADVDQRPVSLAFGANGLEQL
jgi:hypothetical protein